MDTVLFSGKQGEGIILTDGMPLLIRQDPVLVMNQEIRPGESTTLSGFFDRDLMYCGLLQDLKHQSMVFLLGAVDGKTYYKVVHRIANDRIYVRYSPGAGRDYNFRGGKWK